MSFNFNAYTPEELLELVEKAGGQRAFSRINQVPRTTVQMHLNKQIRNAFGHRPAPEAVIKNVTAPIHRYILTSAQDESKIHGAFLSNLEAYRDYLQKDGPCELMIAGFTYNKKLFEESRPDKVPYWHPRVSKYLVYERHRLCDSIDFCAENNSLPTAVTPLHGFETYTRKRWGIFPHAKVQLKSIATMKNAPAKIIMTTGAVTLPNYVRKRAGIVASFHHVNGAVLVEVSNDGTFFCRHLLADDDGSFYDLDRFIGSDAGGQDIDSAWRTTNEVGDTTFVTTGHRVAAINYGDLHIAQVDPGVSSACFGIAPTGKKDEDGNRIWETTDDVVPLVDALRPEYQFFHDVADFHSRNHHNMRDPHHMFSLFIEGCESVESEMREVSMFVNETRRDFCKTVIVESNHDLALRRWLKEADYRFDPANALFFLKCQTAYYTALSQKDYDFSIFQHVLTKMFDDITCEGVQFLREDESFMVLDIEKGMHGHLGANGARGTPAAFTKMGSKATTGHTHSCEIRDGIYTSGTSSKLDMGYNKGMSSWSQSHVVTYANGKRAIITMQNGEWRL